MPKHELEILLAEDDPADLELTMRALRDGQICNHVEVVRDGEQALDFLFCRGSFRERNPDLRPKLILLDLKLPKVNGLEVLEQIKQDCRTRAVPVVILTSSKQEEDMIRGYNLGANSYIQKPVDFDHFRSTIRQLGFYWLLVNQPPPEPVLERELLNDGHKS